MRVLARNGVGKRGGEDGGSLRHCSREHPPKRSARRIEACRGGAKDAAMLASGDDDTSVLSSLRRRGCSWYWVRPPPRNARQADFVDSRPEGVRQAALSRRAMLSNTFAKEPLPFAPFVQQQRRRAALG